MENMDTFDAKGAESSNGLDHKFGEAPMPVDKDNVRYNMSHPKRGKAVIFNNKEFKHPTLKIRNGTDVDRNELNKTLSDLKFEVSIHDDASAYQIKDVIEKLSKEDHTLHDCLLVAVFSHGEENLIYSTDASFKPNYLWEHFTAENCPSLAGKPKIFLFQACQGDKVDSGITLRAVKERSGIDSTDSTPESYRIPNMADFLIVYSTVPGYYSWRNTIEGSWFIQALNEMLRKHAYTLDLLSLMTYVAREVALKFESNVPGSHTMDMKKQVPFITSTLIRELHFSKK